MLLQLISFIGRAVSNGAAYAFAPHRRKVTAGILGVTAVIALALWVACIRSDAAQARLEATAATQRSAVLEAARHADEAALGTTAVIKGTAVSQEVKNRVKTEEALANNPAWTAQSVPADVLSSLRH